MTEEQKNKQDLFESVRLWADEKGITEKATLYTQFTKLIEEVGELSEAIQKNNDSLFTDAIGDSMVVLIILAQLKGFKAEDCLQIAYDIIKERKGKMIDGTFVKEN